MGWILLLGAIALAWWWVRRQRRSQWIANLGGGDGSYAIDVVGESHYLANLREIAGRGEIEHECTASLVLEDDNPHDNKAVAVYIDGLKVGYLRRDVARQYRDQVERFRVVEGRCPAIILGGGEGRRNLGVWLDLPSG